jgi:hypothetical protein
MFVTPGTDYTVSTDGVLTSWSVMGGAGDPAGDDQFKLKIIESLGGDSYRVVAEDPIPRMITPGALNTFQVRIPVEAGQLIALWQVGADAPCSFADPDGDGLGWGVPVEPGVGDTLSGAPAINAVQLNVSAKLEPDADRDSFGDETQDQCPANAALQTQPCDRTAPETTITKDAPKRIDTDKVKFRFESDEASSTFECKLKGKDLKRRIRQFNDCDSPRRYRNLDEGRYRFKVRAIDAAGNVDLTPAKDRFRVLD